MSHHSENPLSGDEINRMMGLGATGHFPHGKIADHDEGEIRLAIAADPAKGVILVDFGKSVRSIGFTYDEAIALHELIYIKAMQLRGIDVNIPLG